MTIDFNQTSPLIIDECLNSRCRFPIFSVKLMKGAKPPSEQGQLCWAFLFDMEVTVSSPGGDSTPSRPLSAPSRSTRRNFAPRLGDSLVGSAQRSDLSSKEPSEPRTAAADSPRAKTARFETAAADSPRAKQVRALTKDVDRLVREHARRVARPPASPRSPRSPVTASAPQPLPSYIWGPMPHAIDEDAPNFEADKDPVSLEPFVEDFVAGWRFDFEASGPSYRSRSLFLETKLRQALLLTVRLGLPNRYRTAAICDCFGKFCVLHAGRCACSPYWPSPCSAATLTACTYATSQQRPLPGHPPGRADAQRVR